MATGNSVVVLKIGGNQVEDPEFLAGFVVAVRRLLESSSVAVVHGGGKEIADLHQRAGVSFGTVEGLRVTSPESMTLVEMVLNGTVNTRLVRVLVNGGLSAVGLKGVDAGMIRVTPMQVEGRDLGLVGRVQQVNAAIPRQLMGLDVVPVISPVSLGADGQAYNVNADQAATGLARALEAARLIFVTNVPGVLVAGRVVRALTSSQAEDLIAAGVISGGMIPKVRAALDAVAAGVCQAVITDLTGLAEDGGTAFVAG